MKILKIENLCKHYGKDENMVKALDDVSFEVDKGEFIVIIGASGSGKSTLLNMLGGLDIPTFGKVFINNENIFEFKEDFAIFRRRNIGFIFQNYNLLPILNVWENIVLPIELDGKDIDENFVNEIIEEIGLKEKIYNMPSQLSGGQQQRVAIARALASKPNIILADEPTGNLDSKTSEDVLNILKNSTKKFNQTIIMITHNNDIAKLADRVIKIEDGKVLL